jgi:hypothetical protein
MSSAARQIPVPVIEAPPWSVSETWIERGASPGKLLRYWCVASNEVVPAGSERLSNADPSPQSTLSVKAFSGFESLMLPVRWARAFSSIGDVTARLLNAMLSRLRTSSSSNCSGRETGRPKGSCRLPTRRDHAARRPKRNARCLDMTISPLATNNGRVSGGHFGDRPKPDSRKSAEVPRKRHGRPPGTDVSNPLRMSIV